MNFSYDNDGLLTGAGPFTIGRNAATGLPTSVNDGALNLNRTFNGYGEEDGEVYTIGSQTPLSWSLTRTDTGRISTRTETVDGTSTNYTYTYDPMDRLLTASKNGSIVEQYQYSLNGTRTYEVNTLRGIAGRNLVYSIEDHLLTAGNVSYQYNLDGFLTSKNQGASTTNYHYSSRGELLSSLLSDGRTIEYLHDPLARRIAKKVNGVITEKYLWQGRTRLMAVYDGNDNLLMRFNYADGRMPISMTKAGATYYLAYDQVGSLKAVTDTVGNMTKKIDYDSFGNIIGDTNPSFTIPFGFAGGLHDRDTGLVRFGYRDYSPEVGRWTAKDPILFAGGDMNLYGYLQNDPVNWMDPFGLTEQAVLIQQYVQGALSRGGLSASSSLVTIEFPNWFVPPYGRWGGPGRSGPEDPIDSLDECFRAHDKNYEKFGINDWKVNNSQLKDRKGCDKEVKNCISKLSFNPLLWKNRPPWWMPIEYATLYRIGSQGLFWLMSR